mmetsp:Transcript_21367/g.50785  ORF Transcript_21367/g.50785 Transcript_21367/m.50785 type:complete len:221 (-) Transcript_21367:124-786(-)
MRLRHIRRYKTTSIVNLNLLPRPVTTLILISWNIVVMISQKRKKKRKTKVMIIKNQYLLASYQWKTKHQRMTKPNRVLKRMTRSPYRDIGGMKMMNPRCQHVINGCRRLHRRMKVAICLSTYLKVIGILMVIIVKVTIEDSGVVVAVVVSVLRSKLEALKVKTAATTICNIATIPSLVVVTMETIRTLTTTTIKALHTYRQKSHTTKNVFLMITGTTMLM